MSKLDIDKVLIIFAHPNSQDSLNAAICRQVSEGLKAAGLKTRTRDLYKEGFDPILSLEEMRMSFRGTVNAACEAEQEHIMWADALVWIAPAWNFSIPAMLKGYLDKVFMIPNFSFASNETGTTYLGGRLQHRKSLIVQTLGSDLRSGYRFGNLTAYVESLVACQYYAGIKNVHVEQFWNIYQQTEPSAETKNILKRCFELGRDFTCEHVNRVQQVSTTGQ